MNKIKIKSSELADRLAVLGKAVSAKAPMPMLEGVLVSPVEDGVIELRTYSTSPLSISTKIRVRGHIEDSTIIKYDWLKKVCDNCKGQTTITIEYNVDNKAICASTIDAVINGDLFDASNEVFPDIEPITTNGFSIDLESLLDAMKRVQFAVCNDKVREIMTGVYVGNEQDNQNELNCAATDGRKLAWNKVWSNGFIEESEEPKEISMVVPVPLIGVLSSLDKVDADIYVNQSNIEVHTHKYVVKSKLIEGRYPSYKNVIPKNRDNYVLMSRYALTQALKRASAFGNSASGLIKVEIKNNKVSIIGNGEDTGVITHIPCIQEGMDIIIGLCSTFIVNELDNLSGDTVKMYYTDPSRPPVLEGAEDTLQMILMPMLVDDVFSSPLEVALLAKGEITKQEPTQEQAEDESYDDEETPDEIYEEQAEEDLEEEEEPSEEDCIGEIVTEDEPVEDEEDFLSEHIIIN